MEEGNRRDKTHITGLCLWGVTDVHFTTCFHSRQEKKTSPGVMEPIKAEADDLHIVRLLILIISTVMTVLEQEAKM